MSRAARQAALAAELGIRSGELGTTVVAEPACTGRPATAAAAAAATRVAAAVSRPSPRSTASRHRTRRTVAVRGAVAVCAVAAARLAGRSVGSKTGRRNHAAPASVAGAGVL